MAALGRCRNRAITRAEKGSSFGDVKLKGVQMFVSSLLAWDVVGLLEVEQDPNWLEVYYGPLIIGWMDLRKSTLRPIGTGNGGDPWGKKHLFEMGL